jgi:putative transcriptional regulator
VNGDSEWRLQFPLKRSRVAVNFFSQKATLEGHVLVASPHLDDQQFFQTVVLLLQHDEDGAYGVVLNRPMRETVQGLMTKLGVENCRDSRQVLLGGPISGAVMALHSAPDCSEHCLPGGFHISAQKMNLVQLASNELGFLQFFVGHAGWEPGQLEEELRVGMWHVLDFDPRALEEVAPEDLWSLALREVGRQALEVLNIRHRPDDPSWN